MGTSSLCLIPNLDMSDEGFTANCYGIFISFAKGWHPFRPHAHKMNFNLSHARKKRGRAARATQSIRILSSGKYRLDTIDRIPTGRGLELVVDVVDVLHTFRLQPLAEC